MSTALKFNNRIYSTVRDAVAEKCQNVVRSVESLAETQYPALVIQLLGSPETTDFQRHDMGAKIKYQADAYAVGPKKVQTASEIMSLACAAFSSMGFACDIRELPVEGNPSMCRVCGRFTAYVGSGDAYWGID